MRRNRSVMKPFPTCGALLSREVVDLEASLSVNYCSLDRNGILPASVRAIICLESHYFLDK
jgi:hypothetical protein